MTEREAMLFSAGFDSGVAIATRIMRDSVSAQIEAAKIELVSRIRMNLNGASRKIEELVEEKKNA